MQLSTKPSHSTAIHKTLPDTRSSNSAIGRLNRSTSNTLVETEVISEGHRPAVQEPLVYEGSDNPRNHLIPLPESIRKYQQHTIKRTSDFESLLSAMKASLIPVRQRKKDKRRQLRIENRTKDGLRSNSPGGRQSRLVSQPSVVMPEKPTKQKTLTTLFDNLPSNLMPNMDKTQDMDGSAPQSNRENNKTNKAFLKMSPVFIRTKNRLRQLIVKDAINEIQILGEGETRLVSSKVNKDTGKMKSNAFADMRELRRYKWLFEVKRMLYELGKQLDLENYTKLGVGSRHMERKVLHARMKEFIAHFAELLEAMQNLKGTERKHPDFLKQKWDDNFYYQYDGAQMSLAANPALVILEGQKHEEEKAKLRRSATLSPRKSPRKQFTFQLSSLEKKAMEDIFSDLQGLVDQFLLQSTGPGDPEYHKYHPDVVLDRLNKVAERFLESNLLAKAFQHKERTNDRSQGLKYLDRYNTLFDDGKLSFVEKNERELREEKYKSFQDQFKFRPELQTQTRSDFQRSRSFARANTSLQERGRKSSDISQVESDAERRRMSDTELVERLESKGFRYKFHYKLNDKNAEEDNRTKLGDYFFKPYVIENAKDHIFTRGIKQRLAASHARGKDLVQQPVGIAASPDAASKDRAEWDILVESGVAGMDQQLLALVEPVRLDSAKRKTSSFDSSALSRKRRGDLNINVVSAKNMTALAKLAEMEQEKNARKKYLELYSKQLAQRSPSAPDLSTDFKLGRFLSANFEKDTEHMPCGFHPNKKEAVFEWKEIKPTKFQKDHMREHQIMIKPTVPPKKIRETRGASAPTRQAVTTDQSSMTITANSAAKQQPSPTKLLRNEEGRVFKFKLLESAVVEKQSQSKESSAVKDTSPLKRRFFIQSLAKKVASSAQTHSRTASAGADLSRTINSTKGESHQDFIARKQQETEHKHQTVRRLEEQRTKLIEAFDELDKRFQSTRAAIAADYHKIERERKQLKSQIEHVERKMRKADKMDDDKLFHKQLLQDDARRRKLGEGKSLKSKMGLMTMKQSAMLNPRLHRPNAKQNYHPERFPGYAEEEDDDDEGYQF